MHTFSEWVKHRLLEELTFACQKCGSTLSISGVSEPDKIHCKKCGGEMTKASAKAA